MIRSTNVAFVRGIHRSGNRVANKDILRWSAMMVLLPRRNSEPHGLNIRHAIDMPRDDACSVNLDREPASFLPALRMARTLVVGI